MILELFGTSEKPSFLVILSSDQIAREQVDSTTLTFSQSALPKNSSKNLGFSEVPIDCVQPRSVIRNSHSSIFYLETARLK